MLLVMVGGAMAPMTALAQVAPPPPEAAPKTPEWVPPPPPPPAQAIPTAPRPPQVRLDFKPWERDESGKLIALTEPVERLAMARNPMFSERTYAKVYPFVQERIALFERVVVENLDLLRDLEGDAIDKTPLDNKEALTKVMNMIRPLAGPGALVTNLEKQRVLSPTQARQNNVIVKSYRDAQNAETEKLIPKPPDGASSEQQDAYRKQVSDVKRRALLKTGVEEALLTHRSLLIEAGKGLDKTLPKLELPSEVKAKVMAQASSVKAAGTDEAKIFAEMKVLAKLLSVEQEQALHNQTKALRPPAPAAPSVDDKQANQYDVDGPGATNIGATPSK